MSTLDWGTWGRGEIQTLESTRKAGRSHHKCSWGSSLRVAEATDGLSSWTKGSKKQRPPAGSLLPLQFGIAMMWTSGVDSKGDSPSLGQGFLRTSSQSLRCLQDQTCTQI